MERLQLTEDLLTGIEEIDNQHRELFARGNAVLFPEGGKENVRDIVNALAFLMLYVDEHFAAEERMMKLYKYDRLEGHRKQHQRLRKDVEALYRRTKEEGTIKGLASELYYLFGDWYVYHIKEWDRAYAAFLQKRIKLASVLIPGLEDIDDSQVEVLKFDGEISPAELKARRNRR
ncbi:MAG: hemerythrin family protein [Desulfobacterales bacterium]|nr:hemerythrin family protein [Desulfobacterales bacterium]